MIKKANNRIKELEGDIRGYNRDIKREPEDASFYDMKADALTELGKVKNDPLYYEQALECRNQAIKLEPENAFYLTARSKLHVTLGRTDLAAHDIAEAQKSPDTGNKLLNMYNTNTTQDILKLDGVQKEISRMIDKGELPSELSAIFSDMIQVITGISTRVSEHDERLGAHDERFERDEAELLKMQEKLATLENQHPNLVQLIENMNTQISSLQSRLVTQEKKISEHEVVIVGLKNDAVTAVKELEQKIANFALSQEDKVAMDKTMSNLTQAVNELRINKGVKEEEWKEVIKGIYDLQKESKLDAKRVDAMRSKIKGIEEKLEQDNKEEKVQVSIVNEITYDNELLNHSELFVKAIRFFGVNETIELGKSLSADLIIEAANGNDYALLLAGAMSLGYEIGH